MFLRKDGYLPLPAFAENSTDKKENLTQKQQEVIGDVINIAQDYMQNRSSNTVATNIAALNQGIIKALENGIKIQSLRNLLIGTLTKEYISLLDIFLNDATTYPEKISADQNFWLEIIKRASNHVRYALDDNVTYHSAHATYSFFMSKEKYCEALISLLDRFQQIGGVVNAALLFDECQLPLGVAFQYQKRQNAKMPSEDTFLTSYKIS